MIWLTWRQSRLEALLGGVALALVMVFLLWTGYQLHDAYNDAGLPSCAAQSTSDEGCIGAAEDFLNQHQGLYSWMGWLNLLPFLLGLLLAAPTILDLEQGTYRLAWTQSVPRSRWLATKIAFGVALAVVTSGVLTLLWSWWRGPFDAIEGRFNGDTFDFVGIVPVAYVVFAFALSLTLGALLRRTIPAVGIGLVAFLAARIGVLQYLRPRYLAPVKLTWDPSAPPPAAAQNQFFGAGNWLISEGYVDATGRAQPRGTGTPKVVVDCMMETTSKSGPQFDNCLRGQDIMHTLVYHPADRFWIFQAIETALFLGVAAALLSLTFWWVTRRVT